jgi:hypothetical protein
MRALLAVVAVVLAASNASAQVGAYLNRTGSGARAAGMANAFVAVSDDGTAASWNPAGLALLRNPEASVVASNVDLAVTFEGYRSLDGLSTFTPRHPKTQSAFLEFASLAVPFTVKGRRATLQADWRRIYDLTTTFGGDVTRQPLRPDGPPSVHLDLDETTQGAIDVWTAAGAVSLGPRLSLGASVNSWRGGWTTVAAVAENAGGTTEFGRLQQDFSLRGSTVGFGALLTWPRLSVGAVYTRPFWAGMTSNTVLRSSVLPDIETRFGPNVRGRLPGNFALGTAFSPRPRWRVALDVTREEWKDFVIEGLPQGPASFFDGQPPETTSARDTTAVNLGAERLVERAEYLVPLRFGVGFEPQGSRDPVTRDPVRYVMVAFGTGINTNTVKIDAAVQYRWTSFQETQLLLLEGHLLGAPDAIGRTASREWRVKVSAIYRLTDSEGLKSFLRRIWSGS